MPHALSIPLAAALCLAACAARDDLPLEVDAAIDASSTTHFPSVREPADNPSTPAKVELGRQIFHDPLLSSDRSVACVTCHGEIWGLSDALQFSIGVGGVGPPGTGRTGPTHTQRNAMTLWNVAYRASMFWDGRAGSLEAQAPFPMRAPHELDREPDEVATDMATMPAYVALFAAAFPGESQPVTADNIARALAAFERTLVSDNAPWDQQARGLAGAMGDDEVRGAAAFTRGGCTACHAPPLFESERYEPSPAVVVPDVPDDGRYEFTHREEDRGRFRVPTLRNLRFTQPYFHNGTVDTVEQAVALEVAFRPGAGVLSSAEITDMVTFLRKSLVDITRTPERPDVAPSGLPVPADELSLHRGGGADGGDR